MTGFGASRSFPCVAVQPPFSAAGTGVEWQALRSLAVSGIGPIEP
jgi:hypothetical protein